MHAVNDKKMKKEKDENATGHPDEGRRMADRIYRDCLGGNEETTAMTDREKEAFIERESRYGLPLDREREEQELNALRRNAREKISAALGIDLHTPDAGHSATAGDIVQKKEEKKWYRTPRVRQAAAVAIVAVLLVAGGRWGYEEYAGRMAAAGRTAACMNDSSLVLSDGTDVRLQGGSKLTTASDFGRRERRVTIDGQAYIHAATDSLRPYIVQMPHGLSLEVKGTAFNVNAYADNPVTEITVVSGCVEITNQRTNTAYGSFRSGDHLAYNSLTDEVVRGKVNLAEKTAWMERHIGFERASVAEFRQKMFEVFGKNVVVADGAFGTEPVEIHASFRNLKDLTYVDVLDDLQGLYHFEYTSKGNTITLTPAR